MKIVAFLIICSMIIYTNTSSTYCIEKNPATARSDCYDLAVLEPNAHCCFLRYYYLVADYKYEYSLCAELSQADYENIDLSIQKFINDYSTPQYQVNVDTLDCKSSYLAISLLGLLLFVL